MRLWGGRDNSDKKPINFGQFFYKRYATIDKIKHSAIFKKKLRG